jgi:hypothetical protein
VTTAQDLIDRATTFGRDSGGHFLTPQDYLDWCNEAQTDLVARLELFEQEATALTDGTNAISFPVDPELIEIQELLLDDTDRVEFIGSSLWNQLTDAGTTTVHTLARVYDEHIEFYPTPETGVTVTIRYKRLPTVLTAGESDIEVPRQLERKVVEYMKAQARFKDGDFAAGNNWLGLYEQGLPHVSDGRERFFTKPISIGRAPNTFDVQLGARHV